MYIRQDRARYSKSIPTRHSCRLVYKDHANRCIPEAHLHPARSPSRKSNCQMLYTQVSTTPYRSSLKHPSPIHAVLQPVFVNSILCASLE